MELTSETVLRFLSERWWAGLGVLLAFLVVIAGLIHFLWRRRREEAEGHYREALRLFERAADMEKARVVRGNLERLQAEGNG